MSLSEDLAVLGLSSSDYDAEDSEGRIRRAYLRLSRTRHPDKGGSNEAFQNLSNAYHRLQTSNYAVENEAASEAEEEEQRARQDWQDDEEEFNYWQDAYYDFFHAYEEENYEDYDEYESVFVSWEESQRQRRKAWSDHHKQQLKRGIDYRDKKSSRQSVNCMFCGVNRAIDKRSAKKNGLNWEEYVQSTNVEGYPGYNTCWACKSNHVSVLTQKQACKKFAKKLDMEVQSRRSGKWYNPLFWALKLKKRLFHHTPQTNMYEGPTPAYEYYWYPDLEREALARGWKPRGKMKEEVPWRRKDAPTSIVLAGPKSPKNKSSRAVVVTPGTAEKKKRKRKRDNYDDRKPSAKPRSLFK